MLVPCATSDTNGLVACYELEDDFATTGVVRDSSANHLDAATQGFAPTTRNNSHAARVMPTASTFAPQVPAFDRAAGFTLALWINPGALPGDGVAQGILDHEGQYAMAIAKSPGEGVTLRCIMNGLEYYEWVDGVKTNAWSLMGCTWDGTTMCAYRWTSPTSHLSNCFEMSNVPVASGSHGLAIGSFSTVGAAHDRFTGDLDSIHVYSRGLSEADMCDAAGQPATCSF